MSSARDLQIGRPLQLKCGLRLKNRLVKAAMAERLGDRQALPRSPSLLGAFEEWSRGDWGLIITGNVDVDPAHIGTAGDVVVDASIPRETTLAAWKAWAQTTVRQGTPVLVQLNHPGRQVQFKKGIAPSPIPMDFGPGLLARLANAIVFGTPKEMTSYDIEDAIKKFVDAAKLAADAGFAGVELHSAHGYLLSQFLSADTNQRTDKYGGSALARATFVTDVISAVRAAVPASFCVGIKLNSVDHRSSNDMNDCIEQLRAIAAAGVDFLEISGGSYEKPAFAASGPDTRKVSTKAREAFFLDFASAIRSEFPDVPLMVTGGFRSRLGMESAVRDGHCDLIGLARPSVLSPALPADVLLNPSVPDEEAIGHLQKFKEPKLARITGVKAIGAGAESLWYAQRIRDFGSAKTT